MTDSNVLKRNRYCSSMTSLGTVAVKVFKPRVGTDDNGELLSTM